LKRQAAVVYIKRQAKSARNSFRGSGHGADKVLLRCFGGQRAERQMRGDEGARSDTRRVHEHAYQVEHNRTGAQVEDEDLQRQILQEPVTGFNLIVITVASHNERATAAMVGCRP
jgi:hypothetical protein